MTFLNNKNILIPSCCLKLVVAATIWCCLELMQPDTPPAGKSALKWVRIQYSTYSAQTWSNSASVSSRQDSAVSNRMLHPNVRSCQSPAAPFCQPPSTRRATLPSQQVRLSGVLYRWFDGLELTAWSPPGPNARLWLFHVTPEDTRCIRHAAH